MIITACRVLFGLDYWQLFRLLTPSVVYMSELLRWDDAMKHGADTKRRGGPVPEWDLHNNRFHRSLHAGLDGLCFDRLVTGNATTSCRLFCVQLKCDQQVELSVPAYL